MAVTSIAHQAYQRAAKAQRQFDAEFSKRKVETDKQPKEAFAKTVKDSLVKVNDMQAEKKQLVTEFATGKNQNVHELMITLQKAGLAMQITTAVRSKVMQAYQEVMRMQF